MWSKAAVQAHQRGKATAQKWKDSIDRLEEMAKYAPALAERVKELKDMRDQLELITATALAIDPKGD